MKRILTIALTALAASCGLGAWAAAVGDQLTFTDLNETFTSNDASDSVVVNSLTIPASDDLPAGSVVTIQEIGIAYRNSYHTYLVLSQSGDSTKASSAVSATENGKTINVNGTDTSVNWASYKFSDIEVTVGTTFPCYQRAGAGGSSTGEKKDLRLVKPNTYTVVGQSSYADYSLVYEVKCTVKSIPTTYTATISGDTAWASLSWDTELPEDLSGARLVINGSGTVTGYNGAAATATGVEVASGVSLEYTENYPTTVPSGANYTYTNSGSTEYTFSDALTVQGTLHTKGDFTTSAVANNFAGTFYVDSGTLTLNGASTNGGNLKSTASFYIASGATLKSAKGDLPPWSASTPGVKIYNEGTMDFGSTRWSVHTGFELICYAGSKVIGVGDGQGAIDPCGTMTVMTVSDDKGTGTVTCSATLRVRSASTIAIDDGMTLDYTGNIINYSGSALTVDGGTMNFSGTYSNNGGVTVTEGTTLVIKSAINQTITNSGMVKVDPGAGNAVSIPTVTGTGTVEVVSGNLDLQKVRDFDALSYTVDSGVVVTVAETAEEYGKAANITVTNVPDGVTVKVQRHDGETYTMTVTDGTATYTKAATETVVIGGSSTLFDVTFKNNLNDGQYTGTFTYKAYDAAKLQYDSVPSFYLETTADESGENVTTNDAATSVYIKHHPYIEGAASIFSALQTYSIVVVGQMSPTKKTQFINLGSTSGSNPSIMIATTDTDNEVMITTAAGKTLNTAGAVYAKVPKAATTRHAYVITKVGDTMKVFVDGTLRGQIDLPENFAMGVSSHSGVQVGSDFGGQFKNITDTSDANYCAPVAVSDTETGYLTVLRVYDYELSDAQKTLVNGTYGAAEDLSDTYVREIAGEVNLSATGAWTKDTETADVPPADAVAKLTLTADATMTVNASVSLEKLTVDGMGTLTFKAGTYDVTTPAEEEGGEATTETYNGSLTTVDAVINTPVVVPYGVVSFAGTAITFGESGSIKFDLSGYDMSTTYVTTYVTLTGLMDETDKVTATLPTATYQTAELVRYNGAYAMKITPDHELGEVQYVSGYWSSDSSNTITLKDATTLFPGDTVVIGDACTAQNDKAWVAATLPTNLTMIRVAKDFTFEAGVDDAILGGVTITVDDGMTLTFSCATRTTTLGAVTINGGTTKLGNVTLAGVLAGTTSVTIEEGTTVKTSANITAPVTGAGTIELTASATLNLADTWTGTVEVDEMTIAGLNFATLGNANSTILVNGDVTGWIAQNTSVTAPIEIAEGATLTVNNGGSNTTNTFAKITGAGNLVWDPKSTTGSTVPQTLVLTSVEGFTGTITGNTSLVTLPEGYGYAAGGKVVKIADQVAKIGETYYATLAEAVSAADSGVTVTLVAAAELSSTVTVNKTLTINLGGYDITATDCRAILVSNGTLTLDGEGTITSKKVGDVADTDFTSDWSVVKVGDNTNETALLVGNDVTITSDWAYTLSYFGKAAQTITVNGTVSYTGTEQTAMSGNGSSTMAETTINVNGTVTSTTTAIYKPEAGTLTVNGKVEGLGGIEVKAGNVVIASAGSVKATAPAQTHTANNNGTSTVGYAIAAVNNSGYKGNVSVTIEGYVSGKVAYVDDTEVTTAAVVTIASTASTSDIEIDDGYEWVNGVLTAKTYVATIGDTKYYTIAEAVAAADAETTVTVIADVTLAARVDIGKSITIDMGECTIKPTVTCGNGSVFNITAGDVTLTGGTLDGTAITDIECDLVTVRSGATVTIASGTYKVNTATGACVYPFNGGKATITGGTFTNANTSGDGMVLNQADVETQLVFVSGGTFSADPAKGDMSATGVCTTFVAEGYESVANEDGTYTVQEKTEATDVTDGTYTVSAEDFAKAVEGTTYTAADVNTSFPNGLTLLENVVLGIPVKQAYLFEITAIYQDENGIWKIETNCDDTINSRYEIAVSYSSDLKTWSTDKTGNFMKAVVVEKED